LFGGVNNLFNQQPAIGTSRYPVDSVGRFFYAGAKVRFNKIM
jgi:outer membrane receptor protein involved in Fe transport